MAGAGAGAPSPGSTDAALIALLLTALVSAAPAPPASAGGGGAASRALDSLGTRSAFVLASFAVAPAAAAPGFTLRRVTNPRYRPALPFALLPGTGTRGPLRAMDHARVQLGHRAYGAGPRYTEWNVAAGEQLRDRRAVEVSIAGATDEQRTDWRTLRLEAQRGPLRLGVGDVPAVPLGSLGSLQRLRGVALGCESRGGSTWRALGGVPTPAPRAATPRLGLAGVVLDGVRMDASSLSLALFGFGRDRTGAARRGSRDADSLAGRGAAGQLGVRAPLALGALAFTLGAQLHDLDGHRGLAARQALGWTLGKPSLVIALEEERNSARTRLLRTEGFALAARREDRWNAQARLLRGRAETHFTGAVREGGESALATRTIQLGGSGAIGRAGWYSGADFHWDDRGAGSERRASLNAGRIGSGGMVMILRFDRSTNGRGRNNERLAAELGTALSHGGRLALEPRAIWNAAALDQLGLGARVNWPLGWPGARLWGATTLGAERDRGYRATLREMAIGVSFTPRPRDRGEIELRQYDESGAHALEATTAYDLETARYEHAGDTFGRRREGLVEVHVVRSGNRSGVADALVSLDGKEFRFTDADGVARFERVAPGVHVVALEERSLPAGHEVVSAGRAFVTVELGRVAEPLRFEIARPARRTRF